MPLFHNLYLNYNISLFFPHSLILRLKHNSFPTKKLFMFQPSKEMKSFFQWSCPTSVHLCKKNTIKVSKAQ